LDEDLPSVCRFSEPLKVRTLARVVDYLPESRAWNRACALPSEQIDGAL
jgi:hypothetical protein